MLRHRVLVLVCVSALTVWMGWVASRLPVLTTLVDMIPADSKGMEAYRQARERFGNDEVVLIAVEADDHFTAAGLDRLSRVTATLEKHPLVERVVSPATVERMRVDPDDDATLIISPYLGKGADAAEVCEAMLEDPFLAQKIVGADGELVLILAQLVPDKDEVAKRPQILAELKRRRGEGAVAAVMDEPGGPKRLLAAVKQLVALELAGVVIEAGFPAEEVHPVGFPVVINHMLFDAFRNINVLFPITVLIIALTLLVLLRRPIDVILPLLCVGPAVVWTIAIGGSYFGRLSILTSIAPLMVLVVGVSDVVHLVTQFRHELGRGHQRDEAIRIAFRHVGAACVLTSVTTFIGFGSMTFLPLPPSRELGVFAGLGVVAAFFLSFTLTPVLLSFTNPEPGPAQGRAGAGLSRALAATNRMLAPYPRLVAAAGLLTTVAVLAAVSGVEVENSLVRKLARDHPVRASVRRVESHLGGSWEMELLVDAGREGRLKDKEVVQALASLEEELDADPRVADVSSVVDLLSRMHELMAPEIFAKQPVPDNRPLIAQYLLLFEMSGGEDLDLLMDIDARHARAVARMRDMSAEEAVDLADHIDSRARELLPQDVALQTSGIGLLAARIGPRALRSALKGLLAALCLIAVLIAVLFRSLRVGLLSLVPNLLPVAIGVFAVASSFEQVDLDTVNMLAVCLGIAVDDTIHFLARYRIERRNGASRPGAIEATILEAGHGILRTSLILTCGFAVMMLSDYQPVAHIGMMLPAVLAAAVILDLTLVPALARLGLLEPRRSSS